MLYAVIMAGGAGTRLWPESRRDRPKQLLAIQPPRTMIQATVDRLGELVPVERTLIATTDRLAETIHQQLPQLPRESIVCEPCPRNTAACIALAAIHVMRTDSDAVMAVMPADHVIEPAATFQEAISFAESLVQRQSERLVTFGIRPTYAAESFGYIERDGPLELEDRSWPGTPPPVYRVKQFHEKPDAATAARYLAAGTFSWNAGIFLWKARTIWDALSRYEPEMFEHLRLIAEAVDTSQFEEVLRREFAAIKGTSIDYAVMERYPEVVVIEAPFDWDDVGSWRSLERLRRPDANGNLVDAARHLPIDAHGNIVRVGDPKHVVVMMGVKDLIVIVTPDATLIANKEDEESIRQVISELKERGWEEYL